ncbi:MAG TPA: hypothetical protein VMV94_15435 [Phycisphaerae bacterium]|nr:hypothetical protein [Phycisphaerae bacterium]
MTNRSLLHYRWIRKAAFVLAAVPLLQLSACQTGTNQVLANFANSIPATAFGIMQEIFLLPIQTLWQLAFTLPTGTTA